MPNLLPLKEKGINLNNQLSKPLHKILVQTNQTKLIELMDQLARLTGALREIEGPCAYGTFSGECNCGPCIAAKALKDE